jgi:hypothetical protein
MVSEEKSGGFLGRLDPVALVEEEENQEFSKESMEDLSPSKDTWSTSHIGTHYHLLRGGL